MMTGRPSKHLRELVASVCDEQLEPGDREHLSELLKSDPIAQEDWLDHLFIDALLQYELGGNTHTLRTPVPPLNGIRPDVHATRSGRLRRLSATRLSLAMLVFAITMVLTLVWRPSTHVVEIQLPLNNSSFEEAKPVSYHPTMKGWYGDTAHIVPGRMDITPADGDHMLRLVKSTSDPHNSCEIYQVIDLRDLPRSSLGDAVLVEALAAVNSLGEDDSSPYLFAMHLYALPENPLDQASPSPATWTNDVSYVGNKLLADLDNRSWQQIHSWMPLDSNAKFLLIQISVRNIDDEVANDYPGQFVDHVRVRLKGINNL